MNKHKVTVPDSLLEQELALQVAQRDARVEDFDRFYARLADVPGGAVVRGEIDATVERMHLRIEQSATGGGRLRQVVGPVLTQSASPRDKQIQYVATALPRLDAGKSYAASHVVTEAMKVFAVDSRVVSIDSDLATTSGLEAGVAAVDQQRALNVGVAEANMMLIGEAFAALGHNTWVSTFCPFFDWKVMRRVAVGQQEREEVMATAGGWLGAGHGLDLTMLATAANFETRTNGATHMGNDDSLVFDAIGQLKIVDVSCPRQLLGLMQWIMEGNRGLVYARVMRTESAVLYGEDFAFEYGRGYVLRESVDDTAVIVSSGRGVHEALAAAARCRDLGMSVGVVDMASVDEALFLRLHDSGRTVFVVEQNNGYLWQNFLKVLHRNARGPVDLTRIVAINTLGDDGRPRFIHSGTYEELLAAFGMTPLQIVDAISARIGRAEMGAQA